MNRCMIPLLAAIASTSSWAAAGAKAPAKGLAIDDVVVLGLTPCLDITQKVKVSDVKFYKGIVQSSGKDCIVVKGTLAYPKMSTQRRFPRVRVTVSVFRTVGPPRILSEMVQTVELSGDMASFMGVGPVPDITGYWTYSVALAPVEPLGGDFKEAEERKSGLKE